MKTTFQTVHTTRHAHREILSIFAISLMVVSVLAFTASKVSAESFTPLTGQMGFGSQGVNVTNLQTFIAANPSIYPEGLVTGYFGGLTVKAVKNFQAFYGFQQVGRVGPVTLAKMNDLIATGGWTTSDMNGPAFYNVTRTVGSAQTTFTFNTNENTTARVVYYTNRLAFNEGDMSSNGFGALGGYAATSINGMGTSHSVTLPNLNANTTYYYTIIATDQSGNISIVGPNNSFITNQ